ncbi:MAG: hypothetical protein WKF84_18225 [Pyrinomonadaceae bacterium]
MHSKLTHIEGTAASDASFMAVERRLSRFSCVAVALMVAFSLPVAPWRVTSGLFIGGLLSLFNYHWLKTSITVAFKVSESEGGRPNFSIWRYVTRYFIIGFTLFRTELAWSHLACRRALRTLFVCGRAACRRHYTNHLNHLSSRGILKCFCWLKLGAQQPNLGLPQRITLRSSSNFLITIWASRFIIFK